MDAKRTNLEPVYTGRFTARLNKTTGLISGSFTNESSGGLPLLWKGVLLQDYTNGYGFFVNPMTTNGGGKVRLGPVLE